MLLGINVKQVQHEFKRILKKSYYCFSFSFIMIFLLNILCGGVRSFLAIDSISGEKFKVGET